MAEDSVENRAEMPTLMEAELITLFLHVWKQAEKNRVERRKRRQDNPNVFRKYWQSTWEDWLIATDPNVVDALITPLYANALDIAGEYRRTFDIASRFEPKGSFKDVLWKIRKTMDSLKESRNRYWDFLTEEEKGRIRKILETLE